MVLTETWLYPEVEGQCGLAGFRPVFKSNSDYRSGGVVVYVREDIQSFEIPVREQTSCDVCVVEIVIERKRIQIAAVYRSPTSAVSNPDVFAVSGISNFLSALDKSAYCFVVGDANLCLIQPTISADNFADAMTESDFASLNNSIRTRYNENGGSLIGHVRTYSINCLSHQLAVVDSKGVSDHRMINLDFYLERATPFQNVEFEILKNMVETADWSRVAETDCVNRAVELLRSRCQAMLEDCSVVYRVTRRLRPIKEWVTPGLVKSMRKRDKLNELYKRTGSLRAKIEYECYNRVLRRLTNRVKRKFFDDKFRAVQNDPHSSAQNLETYQFGNQRPSL